MANALQSKATVQNNLRKVLVNLKMKTNNNRATDIINVQITANKTVSCDIN
jgi:hypothetical protein